MRFAPAVVAVAGAVVAAGSLLDWTGVAYSPHADRALALAGGLLMVGTAALATVFGRRLLALSIPFGGLAFGVGFVTYDDVANNVYEYRDYPSAAVGVGLYLVTIGGAVGIAAGLMALFARHLLVPPLRERQERVLAREEAERAMETRLDPELPALARPIDAAEIGRRVADDLREIYGERLRAVLLFGSWARGDAHPESDIDLLVVLDRVASISEEHGRMDEVLWRHSFENETVVSALVVPEHDFVQPRVPAVIRARAEGRVLA